MKNKIEIHINIRGNKYAIWDDLKGKVPEVVLQYLLQCIKNTALLQLKYPNDTAKQIEERMGKENITPMTI